jgi:hypothetical protein
VEDVADATFNGLQSQGCHGVALAEDSDGNGLPNAWIASYGGYDGASGLTTLFRVDPSLLGRQDIRDAPVRIQGSLTQSWAFATLDVDGDGTREVLIGEYGADDFTGAALLMAAPASGTASIDDYLLRVQGVDAHSWFGWSVANAGDVDADGREDMLVGAAGADQSTPVPGSAYLWLGGTEGALDATSADATVIGPAQGSQAGGSVAGAGDVDGDGFADILVGADSASYHAGEAYLVYGPSLGVIDLEQVKILRGDLDQPFGYAGSAVAGIGDIDGDGLDDLAVGSLGFESWSGGTYLVFGADLQ